MRLGLDEFLADNDPLENFEDTNEIQVTSMLSSVVWWRQQLPDDFDLVHDQSSNFFKNSSMWETLVRSDLAPSLERLGNGSEVQFPLRVRSKSSVSSHSSAAVQLCDIVAGLFGKMMRALQGTERDPFLMSLVQEGVGAVKMSGVNPGPERISGPPPRRNGPDALDRMTAILQPEIQRILAAQAMRKKQQ